jgi:hypothetical protein
MPISLLLFFLRTNTLNNNARPIVDNQWTTTPLINYILGSPTLQNAFVGESHEPASILYPGHAMGVPDFRMLYGVRGVLASQGPIDYEHLPGVRSVLVAYNESVSGRENIAPDTYLGTMRSLVDALRWVTDARCFKALISPYVGPSAITLIRSQYVSGNHELKTAVLPSLPAGIPDRDRDLTGPPHTLIDASVCGQPALGAGAVAVAGSEIKLLHPLWYTTKNGIIDEYLTYNRTPEMPTNATLVNSPNSVYEIRHSTSEERILQIAESSDQNSEVATIIKAVKVSARIALANANLSEREREQIFSLIEMNIIPINVHALMRGVPLANLYNYEVSFDQFAAQILGEDVPPAGRPLKNARQMFLKLLRDPYCAVSSREYGSDLTDNGSAGFVHRIFRGDNGIGMGRPKFLSDQLFNKALFGSVYQSRHDWDEGGPLVGIGAARGINMDESMDQVYDQFVSNCKDTFKNIGADGSVSNGPIKGIKARIDANPIEPNKVRLLELILKKSLVPSETDNGQNIFRPVRVARRLGSLRGDQPGKVGDYYGRRDQILQVFGSSAANMYDLLETLYTDWQAHPSAAMSSAARTAFESLKQNCPITMEKIGPIMQQAFVWRPYIVNAAAVVDPAGWPTSVTGAEATPRNQQNTTYNILMETTLRRVDTALTMMCQNMEGLIDLYRRAISRTQSQSVVVQWQKLILLELSKLTVSGRQLGSPSDQSEITHIPAPNNPGLYLPAYLTEATCFGLIDALGGQNDTICTILRGLVARISAMDPILNTHIPLFISFIVLLIINVDCKLISSLPAANRIANPQFAKIADDLLFRLAAACMTPYELDETMHRSQGTIGAIVPAPGKRATKLYWLRKEDSRMSDRPYDAIRKVQLQAPRNGEANQTRSGLEAIGRMRFDTRFVRNMFFITNVMRLVRMKLSRELTHSRSVLRASHMAVAAGVTEYGSDPFTPNEVYQSDDKMGVSRWDDTGDL